MSAADELGRLEREIDAKSAGDLKQSAAGNGNQPGSGGEKRRSSLDMILVLCAALAAGAVGIYWVQRMPAERATALQNGLIGGSAGVLIGYAVGRLRP